jgi:hypothetical protein
VESRLNFTSRVRGDRFISFLTGWFCTSLQLDEKEKSQRSDVQGQKAVRFPCSIKLTLD